MGFGFVSSREVHGLPETDSLAPEPLAHEAPDFHFRAVVPFHSLGKCTWLKSSFNLLLQMKERPQPLYRRWFRQVPLKKTGLGVAPETNP